MAYNLLREGIVVPVVPRVELTGPGIYVSDPENRPTRSIENMLRASADQIMADMEDACPPALKGEPVRKAVVAAFNQFHEQYGDTTILTFRPNNPDTEWHDEDLESVIKGAVDKFHGIIIPKTSTPKDVQTVIEKVKLYAGQGGWTRTPQLEFLIETALAVVNVERIAEVLAQSGIGAGLIFGIADYAASNSQPEIVIDQNVNFAYQKQRVTNAAHAHGLHVIDNVWLNILRTPTEQTWQRDYPDATSLAEAQAAYKANDDALFEKNRQVAQWGMDGTWVIHPSQVETAKRAFTPSPTQVERAAKAVEEYFKVGGGALTLRVGSVLQLGDTATTNIAIATLGRAVQSGLYPREQYLNYVFLMRKEIGRVHHG